MPNPATGLARIRRAAKGALSTLVVCVVCASCGTPAPQPPASPGAGEDLVVRIGHVGPTTGAIAHLGRDNEWGAQLAVEELNARAMMIGGRRARFELVPMNDSADPRQAVSVAERLVQMGVSAVVGHLNSGTSIPASSTYARAGVAQVSPSATNPRFTRQGHATAFRLLADDAVLGENLGKYAVKAQGARRFVVVDDRTAYGMGIAEDFGRGVVGAGGEVVGRLFTHDRAAEFSQIVSAVGRLRPDAVFVGGMDTLAAPLLRQLRAAGVRTRMFGGDGICTVDLPRHAGGTLARGDVVCAEAGGVMPGQAQAMREFQARFRARFKEEVVAFAPYSYDAVYVIADAMRRAGSTSRDAVAKALPAADMAGVTGRIRFDARGDIVNGAFTIHTYAGPRRERLGVVLAE